MDLSFGTLKLFIFMATLTMTELEALDAKIKKSKVKSEEEKKQVFQNLPVAQE